MTMIKPPTDLSASERKAFKKHAQVLEKAGISPSLRADLIADFVRSETRLKMLREAEKQSENASKLAANRAVTTASAERRRLHDLLYRGASLAPRTQKEKVARAIAAAPGSIDTDEKHEAWRDVIWWRARGLPEPAEGAWEATRRKYGEPGLTPLIYWCIEEETAWKRGAQASNGRPSRETIEAMRAQIPGGKFAHEHRAPRNYVAGADG